MFKEKFYLEVEGTNDPYVVTFDKSKSVKKLEWEGNYKGWTIIITVSNDKVIYSGLNNEGHVKLLCDDNDRILTLYEAQAIVNNMCLFIKMISDAMSHIN